MSDKPPMPVTLIEWKPLVKGHLLGFAKIQLGAMKIHDVAVLSNTGRRWANLPSKPQTNGDTVKKNEAGKVMYVPLIEWTNKESADRFSEAVIAAVEQAHGPIG